MAKPGRSSAPTSDRWFAQLENLKTILRLPRSKSDASYAPTKIAILDTGIDKSHSSSVVEYRDFLDPKDVHRCDSTGHGTSAFKLLQKVYPEAQIFVGRVWESNQANHDTENIMTKVHQVPASDAAASIESLPNMSPGNSLR